MQSNEYKFDYRSQVEDFFIVLPSNTPSVFDRDKNTMASYTVNLPRDITFHGDWYIGLTEITYTKSWISIENNHLLGIMKRGKLIETGDVIPRKPTSIPALIQWLNMKLSAFWNSNNYFLGEFDTKNDPPYFMFPENELFIKVFPGSITSEREEQTYFWPHVGEEIMKVLGLATPLHLRPDLMDSGAPVQGVRKPDLSVGIDALFVYSDVVSPTIVGDTAANILKVVPVTRAIDYGENVDVIFPHPYYYKVSKREVSRILINIKDETGNTVPFEFGRVIVTLHFKRWKPTM